MLTRHSMLVDTEDAPGAAADARISLGKWLRFGALGLTIFGFVDDPTVRLLLLLAVGLLAVQSLALALCTMTLRPFTASDSALAEPGDPEAWREPLAGDQAFAPHRTALRL
jgi:hypothetical protein